MKNPGQPMISEPIVEAAKQCMAEVGWVEAQKLVRVREPHLYAALCALSNCAMTDRDEALGDATQTAIRARTS